MLVVREELEVGMMRGSWGPRGPGFWSLLVVFQLVSSLCVGQSLCRSGAACRDEAQRESELPFPDASRLVGLLTEGCDIHGDRVCCEELSSYSFSGAHGVSVNPVVGLAYLREACLLGSESSCERWLGLLLEGGPGLSADPGAAVPELRTRCNGPPSQGWACYELGVLYAEGRGVAAEVELSERLFSAACSAGDCRGEAYVAERVERQAREAREAQERAEREAREAQERETAEAGVVRLVGSWVCDYDALLESLDYNYDEADSICDELGPYLAFHSDATGEWGRMPFVWFGAVEDGRIVEVDDGRLLNVVMETEGARGQARLTGRWQGDDAILIDRLEVAGRETLTSSRGRIRLIRSH